MDLTEDQKRFIAFLLFAAVVVFAEGVRSILFWEKDFRTKHQTERNALRARWLQGEGIDATDQEKTALRGS